MADERNYFVLCESNCKFPAMTKEQILTAIAQAVSTGTLTDIDTGFVTKIKEQNNGAGLAFWVGKQAQYNAIEVKQENCFYIITDDTTQEDLLSAIKELGEEIKSLSDQIAEQKNKNGEIIYNFTNDREDVVPFGDDITAENIVIPSIGDYSIVKVDTTSGTVLCHVNRANNNGEEVYVITGAGTGTFAADTQHRSINVVLEIRASDGLLLSNNSSALTVWIGDTPKLAQAFGVYLREIIGVM